MTPEEKEKELNDKLRELSGSTKYEAGRALYEDGAVLDILRDSRGIDTRVANEMGRFEKVRITLKKNYFSAKCTCRSRGTAICEHSVAAFLQFYKEYPEAVPFPLASPSTSTKTKPLPEQQKADHTGIEGNVKASGQTIQQMTFSSLLDDLKEVKGHVVLIYKGEGFPAGESRWNNCPFTVELHYADKVYSGSNIKRLVETGSAAAGMRFSHFSPQDQQIMRFFSNHGELSGSLYVLNAVDMGALFHCLIGFRRFYSGTTKINVNKQIAELVFQIVAKQPGVEIEPRMRVEGYGLLPTHDIDVIGARSGFWLGYQGQYWWIPAISGPAWLHSFLKGETVAMNQDDYNRLREQCTGGLLPVMMVDREEIQDTTISAGSLVPILSLDWQQKALQARLEFSYEGIRITMNSEKMIWNGSKYIMRDEVGEEKIVKKLQQMGFIKLVDPQDTFRMKSLEKMGEFLDLKLPKLSKEWEIYCSMEFERNKNMCGDIKLSVATTAESSDWFELKYNFYTKPGVSAEWKNVIDAVLAGQNYVRLDAGGVAKITPKIKEAIELNLNNAFEEGEEDTLRFSHYNAAYIGNALSTFKVDAKSKWYKLCKRLGKTRKGKKHLKLGNQLDNILRDYQKDGVTWLNAIEESGFHGILADEMGLGKTIQTLASIQASHNKCKANKTSLIICPTSLVQNWAVEAKKFIPDFKVGLIYGNNRQKVIDNLKDYDLVITSYALVRRDIEGYKDFRFHYVALDEAQHIKNPTTANARTSKEIKADHRLMLTGTPVENAVREIWSLFDFIMPGYLGSVKEFQEKFERKSQEERQIATQQLADKIRPFMLRRKKIDVCDELPPKIEQVVYCELADKQRELYDNILVEAKRMLQKIHDEGVQKYRIEMLSVLLRLRQLCCHPMLLPEEIRTSVEGITSAKVDLFKELVMESIDSEHRMLVFSQFTGMLGLLREWLEEEGIKYEYLDGSTTNRMARVDNFNNDTTIPIFLLSLKAGGTGLNLTGADTVIHYDQWWNPMVEDQATDRTHRIGQTKQVVAYKLVSKNTVEEKIVQLQDSKRELFNQIMAGVPADINELTEEDFEFLLSSEESE